MGGAGSPRSTAALVTVTSSSKDTGKPAIPELGA
jgi:hypothetical protein